MGGFLPRTKKPIVLLASYISEFFMSFALAPFCEGLKLKYQINILVNFNELALMMVLKWNQNHLKVFPTSYSCMVIIPCSSVSHKHATELLFSQIATLITSIYRL